MEGRCLCGQEIAYAYPVTVGIGRQHRGWLFTCAACLAIERACFGEPETVRRLADGPQGSPWERMKIVLSDTPLPVSEIAGEINAHERTVRRLLREHPRELAPVAIVNRVKVWGLA